MGTATTFILCQHFTCLAGYYTPLVLKKKKKRHFKSLFSKHKLHFHVTTSQFLGTTTYIQQGCNPEQQQALL